jgi:hypothetical protein
MMRNPSGPEMTQAHKLLAAEERANSNFDLFHRELARKCHAPLGAQLTNKGVWEKDGKPVGDTVCPEDQARVEELAGDNGLAVARRKALFAELRRACGVEEECDRPWSVRLDPNAGVWRLPGGAELVKPNGQPPAKPRPKPKKKRAARKRK